MAGKVKYTKPKISEEKIQVSFFASGRFLDSAVASLVPPVFAQSGGGDNCGATCAACGGGACGSCLCNSCAGCGACYGCFGGPQCDE